MCRVLFFFFFFFLLVFLAVVFFHTLPHTCTGESVYGEMASSPSLAATLELLKCTECLEQFVDPRLLSCQHTFCCRCLKSVVKKTAHLSEDSLSCPCCRQTTPLPPGGPESLPKSPVVEQLLLDSSCLEESRSVEHKCEECVDGKESSGFCVNCSSHMCADCLGYHNRNQRSKMHTVLTTEEFEAKLESDPSFLRQRLEPDCEHHPGEKLKVFCKPCKKATCHRCAIAKHKHCELRELQDVYGEKVAFIGRLLSRLQAKRTLPLQAAIVENEGAVAKLIGSREASKEYIRKKFDDCRQMLAERERALLREVDEKSTKLEAILTDEHARLNAELQNSLLNTKAATNFMDMSSMATVALASGTTEDRLTKLLMSRSESVKKTSWSLSPMTFSLSCESFRHSIKDIGKIGGGLCVVRGGFSPVVFTGMPARASVQTFGNSQPYLEVERPLGASGPVTSLTPISGAKAKHEVRITTRSAGKHRIHIRLEGSDKQRDSSCSFEFDSTRLPKKAKKKVGSQGTNSGHFNWPSGITFMDDGGFLVADYSNKRIQEFSAVDNPQAVNTICGRGCLRGVAVHPSSAILATDQTNHCVQVFSRDGQPLHSFGATGDADTKLNYPVGISVDQRGHVVVCENGNNRIQVFDIHGQSLARYSRCADGRELDRPSWNAVDMETGNIFVTSRSNAAVEVFSKDGHHLRSLSECGELRLKDPRGVAVDPSGNIAVADGCSTGRITIWSQDGSVAQTWSEAGDLGSLCGLGFSNDGRAAVCDSGNNQVILW